MIELKLTEDFTYIESVFLNPAITHQMRDDSVPENCPGLIAALRNMGGFYLKVLLNGVESGMFWLRPTEEGLEAHTALLPNCRGKDAVRAARDAVQWVFANTDANVITSYAWSDSPAVAWFCRAAGLTPYSTEPWPNTRKGQPVNITRYKIERDE